jgi:adenylylsulfate kinase
MAAEMTNETGSPPRRSGFTVWLTGLPCAGKSTLAIGIGQEFVRRSRRVEILDADVLRSTLCRGLGFAKSDRDENIARIGWVCGTLNRHGVIAVAAAVSPYREARQRLRDSIPSFLEIFVKTPLSVCIERDVKGMYARALSGQISLFTGIDDPYEEPLNPNMVIETTKLTVEECVDSVFKYLERQELVAALGPSDEHSARDMPEYTIRTHS